MRVIDNRKWYKPMEIAKLGLIQSSAGTGNVSGNYNFVLKLIRAGRLRAKDYATSGTSPYWLVPEDEIARYHKTITKV